MVVNQRLPEAAQAAIDQASALDSRYGRLESELIIELAIDRFFPEQIATVSSFGADSAVLLHMISEIDPTLPVLFLDTGKHFAETIEFRDSLIGDLGLTDLRIISPDRAVIATDDPEGDLHTRDADACCAIRKVEPMNRAVEPYGAWFNGRKRFQSGTRKQLPVFEAIGHRIRINPLAHLTPLDIKSYLYTNELRKHPLVAKGYLSIGCQPCTAPVNPGESARSGRWAGLAKTECGIHLTADGVVRRPPGEIGVG